MIARLQAHQKRTVSRVGWRIRSLHLRDLVWLAGLFWLAMLVVTTAISFGIDYRGTVTSSTWDQAVNAAPRWFLAILSGYLAYTIVPMLIAYGRTRREAAAQLLRFVVAGSVIFTLLAVLGFLLEKGLYVVMDWNQSVAPDRLYGASTDVHLIFTEIVLTLLVWSASGVAIGAGFYRSDEAGWSVAAVIWIPVVLASALIGARDSWEISLPFIEFTLPSVHPLLALLLNVIILAGIIVVGWRLIRDVPLRSKTL